MLTMRQSAINTYEKCMYKGLIEWGDIGSTGRADEEELTNKYARVGIIFHEVMEYWGKNKLKDIDVPVDDLHKMLDTKLDEEDKDLFESEAEIEKYRVSLHEQLEWTKDACKLSEIRPLGVEVTFNIDDIFTDFIKCTGTIDRIDGNMKEKRIRLGDYKTGKVYTKKELTNNIQATLYSLAFYKQFGFMPEAFDFYFTKFKKVKTIMITPEFIKEGTLRIMDIWYKIKLKQFEPNCSSVYFCKNFCDIYKRKECPKFKKTAHNNAWDNIDGTK